MAFAAIPPLLGILAHGYDPALASPEMALPTVLVAGLPPAIGMLTLAAILSAEMSSADAALFMLSTSLSKDLYRRFLNPSATDHQTLHIARIAAVTGGAAATGLALLLPTVISSLTVFYSTLTVALTVPVIAGLFSRRPGVPEALCAIGAGTTALVAAAMLSESVPGSLLNPVTLGLLLSSVGFGAVYLGRRAIARA